MKTLDFKETINRGSFDLPIGFYHVDEQHPQYVMPYHWHGECELIYIVSGSFDFEIDAKSGTAVPGDALFVNCGVLHRGTPNNCVYICLVFDMDILLKGDEACRRLLSGFADGSCLVNLRLSEEDKEIPAVICNLASVLDRKNPGYELRTRGLLLEVFGQIYEKKCWKGNAAANIGSHKKIRQLKNALSLIQRDYAYPLTLSELAEAAEMSPKYFCHFFRRMTSMSPVEYLNRHRIEAARARLLCSFNNVTELAYECGFNDLSYFIRIFKKHTGLSPKQFAVRHKNKS